MDGSISKQSGAFSDFLDSYYPEILKASPKELLETIQSSDTFSNSLPVYSYVNGKVQEFFCEEYGWPNTTHCGKIMFENTFFPVREACVKYAKEDLGSLIGFQRRRLADLRSEIEEIKKRISDCELEMNLIHPSLPTMGGVS